MQRNLRLLLAVAGIAGCLLVIKFAAAYGSSRVFGVYALAERHQGAADQAVALGPNDAEAHLVRGVVMSQAGRNDLAIGELERAVALRPSDFGLWLELGLLRDQVGQQAGALTAFAEAVKRAPFYAQPHWQRGNLHLRQGDYESAFADLNQAARSNPQFLPGLIDLAWSISRGDVRLTEQLAQINDERTHLAFARVLGYKDKPDEVLKQVALSGAVPAEIRAELVQQLLAKGALREAYRLSGEGQPDSQGPVIFDGGFEATLAFDQGGFVWRVPRNAVAANITQDSQEPDSGSRSLRVDFAGNSNPDQALLAQVIPVVAGKRYQVNFAGRSHDVVTGGLPLVTVNDATGDHERLGQSRPLEKGTGGWQRFSFQFTAPPGAAAVTLSLQRVHCAESPCPIFGSISLDSFSLAELP